MANTTNAKMYPFLKVACRMLCRKERSKRYTACHSTESKPWIPNGLKPYSESPLLYNEVFAVSVQNLLTSSLSASSR